MLKVTEFRLNHLAQVEEGKEIVDIYHNNPEILNWYTDGPGYTMYDEDGIIAMGGLCLQGGGLALAWSIPTKRVKEYPIYFTKIGKWILQTGLGKLGLHKVFCLVDPEDPVAIGWAEVVGFEREALLKKHNWDGKDVYLYSIFKEAD